MDTGQFDRVMLDVCFPGTTYLLPLLTKVRNAIGPNGLIIVNANAKELSHDELGEINGVFMESGFVGTGQYGQPSWGEVKNALDYNETWTRTPRVNCLQDWYSTSPDNATDVQRMRAITTLGLTHSNGYVRFGYTQYNWYDPFWSGHSLGVPVGTWYTVSNYGDRRDFKNGSAIWNSSANQITVTFPELWTSLATGQRATSFVLAGNDGGIYTY